MMKKPVDRRKRILFLALAAAMVLVNAAPVLAAGGGHGDAEPKGWVATDTYRVMNFVVLIGGLFFVLRKPVAQALSARIKGIQNELEDLEARKQVAEKELAEYSEKLALLEKEAEQILADYQRQGEESRARIIEEARGAAAKLEEQAKRHIEHEFKAARERLQAEVIEKALEKAEGLLREKITAQDQDRLIDEYLAKVVAQ